MLHIEHFTKRYGGKTAVDDLSLHVAPGELCAFIGHNGAGKTTTLKACCGLLQADEGTVTVGGVSVKDDPLAAKRLLAYIPDNPDLYEFLSGYDFLNFVADIYGIPKDVRAERIGRLGDQLEITGALPSLISEYSHGMKQKVAVLAAFLHEPKLLLMDEPFVGLDPVASHQLKLLMTEHCEKGGAILYSTHVLEVAEKLCDRVAILQNGRLVANGTMDEVKGDSSLESVFLGLAEQKEA